MDTDDDFLHRGGDMGARIRAHDWASSPLGPMRQWPANLRSALGICLGSRFPIALYWGEQRTLLYNDAWSPILGTKHPWALGRAGRDVWPEIWNEIGPLFEQVTGSGESTYSEDSLLSMHRHGYTEECYFNFTFTPVRGARGAVDGIFNAVIETTYRAISERRSRLLRELADQLAGVETAADACDVVVKAMAAAPRDASFSAVYLLERDTHVRMAAAQGLPGTSAASLPLDDAPWPFRAALQSGEVQVVGDLDRRLGVQVAGGAWPEPTREALVALVPGRAGFVVIGASPRRAVDDAYREFAERAASHLGRVLAAAAALAAEKRRAEELAELDRAKTTFFSNISHEFRTPLTLLLAPLDDAVAGAYGPLPPALAGDLAMMRRNGYRLLKLVNALLDFSRIEAGRVEASYEPTDLAAYTAELASAFRSAVEKAGMQLVVDAADVGEVHVDREMWEKIVLNLLSNAFKYTLEGSIRVAVRRLGDEVELAVADTGVGIPRAAMPRLFERFYRVEGVEGRTHEGTGIGLALVHELVKLHGGRLTAESEVGVGSTFRVTLPLGVAHLPSHRLRGPRERSGPAVGAQTFVDEALRWLPAAGAPSAPAGATTAPAAEPMPNAILPAPVVDSLRGARVVLADDNADMRGYVERLLVSAGFHVTAVGDGDAALRALRAQLPDLLLADVMMPGRDGMALLRDVRGDERMGHLPVILLSARAGQEAIVAALAAGADDYMVKPFSSRELRARVEGAIKLGRMRTATLRETAVRARLHGLLAEIGEQAALIGDGDVGVRQFAERICARVAEETGVDRCGLASIDVGRDSVHIEAQATRGAPPIREPLSVQQHAAHVLADASRGRPTVVTDLQQDPRAAALSTAYGTRAHVSVPLQRDGRWVATFWISTRTPRTWTADEVQVVAAVGERLWLAFEHARTNAALRRSEGELRKRDAERSMLLANERAMRADLERTSRLKDEFLASLSHELRTPLNAVLGWSFLLRKDVGNAARVAEGLTVIERNARLQAHLIADLLDMGRIIAGKMRLQVEFVELPLIVASAMESIQPSADAKGVRLVRTIESADAAVHGDSARLQQIVWNLLSNAVKFSRRGGRVQIVVRRVNSHVELIVSDTGEGIAPEFLPHIFERFRQADSSTTRAHGGLGLGLSIVQQLVELHGGTVHASSEGRGKGATFVVKLPLAAVSTGSREEVPQAHPSVPASPDDQLAADELRGARVLVVDDDEDARVLVGELLAARGASVRVVESGQEALQALHDEVPDLLISDIGMPHMDGYELIREVRARGVDVPAIALTAFARSEDRTRALVNGYQTHVAKPVEPIELVAAVAAMLPGRGRR